MLPSWLSRRPSTTTTAATVASFELFPVVLTVVSALPGFTQKSPDGIEIGKAVSGPFHFSSLLIGCIRFDMGCLLLPIFL